MMSFMKTKLLGMLLVSALLLTVGSAQAAAGRPTDMPPNRERGVMLQVGLGVSDCTDNWCLSWSHGEIGPLLGVPVVAMFRINQHVAAGVHGAFLFGNGKEDSLDLAWHIAVGAEVRGYLPYKIIDPWMGLTLGFARSMVMGENGNSTFNGWQNGFMLGFGFGADIYVLPKVAVGASFYLYKPWYDEYCLRDEESNSTECVSLSDRMKNDVGIVWTVTANVTFFFKL